MSTANRELRRVERATHAAPLARRSFLKLGALGALSAASLGALPPIRAAAAPAGFPTTRAFLDSIGVNVHWSYPDTPYGYAYDRVRTLLTQSGIRHVRGEIMRSADLFRVGIRTTVLSDIQADGSGTPAGQVASLASLARAGAIAAVEGPNEPDLFWSRSNRRYKGLALHAGVLAWQRDLWNAVKGDSRTRTLPVIGPSFGMTYWGGGHPFPAGSLSPFVDFGNFHPYPSGNPFTNPYPYAGISQYYRHSNFPSNTLDDWPINFDTYRPPFSNKPMMATETGYATHSLGQSERVQALYTPRLLLEYFRLGIRRTYLYELVDEFTDPSRADREAHLGLIRHDLTPKPAYHAVKNLIAALSDNVTDAPAQPFNPVVTAVPAAGYDAGALHHLVLSKGGSKYVMALWHEVSANDISGLDAEPPRRPKELSHPPMTVRIALGRARPTVAARRFDGAGALRVQGVVRRASSLELQVSDHVTLLNLEL